MKRVFDEVHGTIELDDIAIKLIDQPELQRLRRIRQTSLAFVVYPGANHTRFSHALGTYYLAEKIGNRLVREGVITDDELNVLKVSSLLHDVGQFPFSHAIESFYIKKGLGNKDLREMVLRGPLTDVLNESGLDSRKVRDLLNGESLLTSVIDGDVDVDRMDYLIRDSTHTGIQLGRIDLDRLILTIMYRDNGITIQDKGIISLENFYLSRLHMYQAVYYHKTILGYELFLTSLYSKLVEECESGLEIDDIRNMINQGTFPYWDDEWVFGSLYRCYSTNPNSPTSQMIKDFLDRRGPKVVYEEIDYDDKNETRFNEVTEILSRTLPQESLYPFEETISIFDRSRIKVISRENELPIAKFPTLLRSIPERLVIRRVYVDRRFVNKARELI
ncbi:HD domain-containing protein [Metallosphaera hakonensis]|uniref:HD domain-containing protein n=1 Tax=Metallosphaera hakonensis JCM 8857 = DSM 7519 TaxID=1293036 RepID=A0A2U9IU96_9CREN|nr:HD domain-containing protein [Metallosphaera hakonensis]AWR99608.1 HD domain-containing protein [Metallosphaera hakonensis JCM 8857 = DSM 7519]